MDTGCVALAKDGRMKRPFTLNHSGQWQGCKGTVSDGIQWLTDRIQGLSDLIQGLVIGIISI